jgi:hypothetical protein
VRAALIRIQRGATVALACLCIGTASSQQHPRSPIEASFAQTLTAIAKDDALLDQFVPVIYGQDLSSEKHAIAKTDLQSLLRNEQLPAYLVLLLRPVASSTLTEHAAQAIVADGIASLKVRGLRRLPAEQQARALRLFVGVFRAVPPALCKAMILGQLDTHTANTLGNRYNASLPLREFRAFIALTRNAVEAELAGYPDVRAISPRQAEAAELAHMLALRSRAERLPLGLLDRTQDLAAADPAEACLLVCESLAAGIDLAEPHRGWWLTRYFGTVQ